MPDDNKEQAIPTLESMPLAYRQGLTALVMSIDELSTAIAHAEPRSVREPLRRKSHAILDQFSLILSRYIRSVEAEQ